ncbi:hypothetical protein [Candidatus Protochlamydia phocaeensis]|uniref:hypothetical protein n=1 Tax=Candidatus Protochlamydia phocaeensis TaxID=1414722 RepID=UPI000837D91E|nr:hypothetical protein [Candidatus Protochlamydia phocaeensis]
MSIPSVGSSSGSPTPPAPQQPAKQSFFHFFVQKWAESPYQNILTGLLAGTGEVIADHPLAMIKNDMIQGTFSWKKLSFKTLYAGAGANIMGMGTNTAVAMYALGYFRNFFSKEDGQSTAWENLCASIGAGAVASPTTNFFELMIIRYNNKVKQHTHLLEKYKGNKRIMERLQRFKPSYSSTFIELWKSYHCKMFTIGLPYMVLREIGFTAAYGAGGRYMKDRLKEAGVSKDWAATIGGGILAGFSGAVITQPFDNWTTRRKVGMPLTFSEAFQGLTARSARVASAITIFCLFDQWAEELSKKVSSTNKETE